MVNYLLGITSRKEHTLYKVSLDCMLIAMFNAFATIINKQGLKDNYGKHLYGSQKALSLDCCFNEDTITL